MATAPGLAPEQDEAQQTSAQQSSSQQNPPENTDPLEGRDNLKKVLWTLFTTLDGEQRYPRMVEVREVTQAHFYWRSLQYLWWSQTDRQWNLPNQNHGLMDAPADAADMPRFEFVTNIYQAFGLSLIAAIAQAPPRVRFFPTDAEIPEDVETAEGFEKLAKIIETWNPVSVRMQDEVYHLWTGGAVVGWTHYISDEKFGTEEVTDMAAEDIPGEMEARCNCGFTSALDDMPDVCPECGKPLSDENIVEGEPTSVPAQGESEQVPKGRQVVEVYGVLNFKRPQYARSKSEFIYCAIVEEIHYAKLRAAYPGVGKKIQAGAGLGDDDQYERNARLSVMQGAPLVQQVGEASKTLTTHAHVWMRPEAFWHDCVSDDDREALLGIFPNGCRVNFAGDVYCESEAESMDDCVEIAHAIPGDGQHRPAIGSTLISVQDRFNTFTNIEAETYEYGIPVTYADASIFDEEARDEQRAEPGDWVPTLPVKLGDNLENHVLQLRSDSISADMYKHTMDLIGPVGQFLSGAFPALLGAGAAQGAAGDTASGYKMQMEQALGRCGVSYVRLKFFHADMSTLACKNFRANATGKASRSVTSKSGDFEAESVDVTALEGDARAYPEGDENFPVLWTQQRAVFMEIMQSAMGQALLTEPDNAELAVKLIGVDGLVVPGAAMRRYGMRVIGELTETVPNSDPKVADMSPDMSAEVQGMVGPRENHAMLVQVADNWLFSEAGLKCKRENPTGYHNVEAWAAAQQAAVPPTAPQEKPLSKALTAAIDKLPPEAQAQILQKEYGIELSPEDFISGAMLEALKKRKPQQGTPALGVTPNPVAGA